MILLRNRWESQNRHRCDTKWHRPKASKWGLPMGTEVPNMITWDYYACLGSQYCFVSNELISILSYFSHRWPRDWQTFYINSQVVNTVGFVGQVVCLNYSTWPCGLKAARQYTIEQVWLCSNKTLQKQAVGQIWPLSYFLPTPTSTLTCVDGFEGGQKGGSWSLNLSGTRAFACSLQLPWAQQSELKVKVRVGL